MGNPHDTVGGKLGKNTFFKVQKEKKEIKIKINNSKK